MSDHIPLFDDAAFQAAFLACLQTHYQGNRQTGIVFDGPGAPNSTVPIGSLALAGVPNMGVEADEGGHLVVIFGVNVDASYRFLTGEGRHEPSVAPCRVHGFVEIVLAPGAPADLDLLTFAHVVAIAPMELTLDLRLQA